MKNINLHFLSLLSIAIILVVQQGSAQSSAGCKPFLCQKDTTICPGVSVTLNLVDPPAVDTVLPGVWKLLINGSSIDSILFNIKPFGYDKTNQYLYSIIHQRIIRFDLKNNSVSSVSATNWPGDYTEFTYDYTNNRLLCWRAGRDSVFALPAAGGSWTVAGEGTIDRECFGASSYWNPVTKQPGIYGGYGYNQMKSWIFENSVSGWVQRKSNPLIDSVPPKGGNLIGGNSDGTKLYLFSGQGSYSGDELAGTCTLGSPWATSQGMFCWLRDLWELDLSTYTFKNILPVNNQTIQYEGAVAYDYDKSRFYLFGGFQPTGNYAQNQSLSNTNKTFRYSLAKDTGFSAFTGEADVPPPVTVGGPNGLAYYDPVDKRMIWARYDGIWAYYPDSTTIPVSVKSFLWSTGDTTASINVKPTQTTRYKITRTSGGLVCSDSILITVPNMKTALQQTVNVCGDSTKLDAGTGFTSYVWNTGDTTQFIPVHQNGTYSVTVTKTVCSVKDSSKVQLATPILDFSVRAQKDTVCAGDPDSLFVIAPQSGITYSWYSPGSSTVINSGPSYQVNNVTKNLSYIVNATSNPPVCSSKSAVTQINVRTPLPRPAIHADSVGVSTIIFSWGAVQGATGYIISLDNGNTFSSPLNGPLGLTQTITGLPPNQTEKIVVKALGPYSCQTSDTSQLSATTLNPFGDGIYVPNAFTPNADGNNDVFLVYGTAIASIRLMVYNQWGGLVFTSTDIAKGWDGTYSGGRAPASVYAYTLEAVMQDGKRITKRGSFTLIR